MFGTKTDLSQQELIQVVEGYRKLTRAFSGLLRQVGRGEIAPDDAATRLQAVTEGRAPDASAPNVPQPQRSPMDEDASEPVAHGMSQQKRRQYTERAQHAVQQGRITKAIGHLERILEDDPRDVRTLLKIGDLQSKQGDVAAAIQTYLKVAAFYAEQGFYLKAVAVYKQILGIDENLDDVHARLADLYHQLGLMQDAMVQYELLAQAYDRKGQVIECLAVRRKIVELDPQNIQHRIKLAEAYSKNGLTSQATQEFEHVANALKEHRRIDDYLKVAERLVHHDPSRADVMLELARIYLQKGQTKRALAKLQTRFKSDPNDIETLNLLQQAFIALKQPDRAALVREQRDRVLRFRWESSRDDASSASEQHRVLDPLEVEVEREEAERMVDVVIGKTWEGAASDDDASGHANTASEDNVDQWKRWMATGDHGPIADEHDDAMIQELLGYFADLAQPTFVGPVPALRGLARCADALGERGRAIEAYDALLMRFKDDPNAPDWLADVRAKIAALRGMS